MSFDAKLFETTLNEILPELTMYVRDVNLPDKLAEKYVPDTIILERGFTDASSRVMGMKTTHRFAILSNHMGDLTAYEHGTNWGLFVAASNSHFLILDKYEYHGKTQIILLHLPNDKRWKLFRNVKVNVLNDIVQDTRKRFESKSEQEVIPELATKEYMLTAKMYEALKSDIEYTQDKVLQYVKAKGRIMEYVQETGSITNTKVRELCGFTRQQARSTLEKMQKEGVIVLLGKGRYAKYVAMERLC